MTTTCLGKVWVVTSFMASMAAALGFYLPYWLEGFYLHDNGEVIPMYFGVFRRCTYPYVNEESRIAITEECGTYEDFLDIPSIFWQISTVAVGAGNCLALIVSLTALTSLCIHDIITVTFARAMGLLQLCSGLMMGGGVAIYPWGWGNNEQVAQACGASSHAYELGRCRLFWAFYLTAAGAGLTLLMSTLSCSSYKHKYRRRPLIQDV